MTASKQFTATFARTRANLVSLSTAPPSDQQMQAVVLHWFAQMHAGQIDRMQLAPEYSAHLTDDAVRQMSEYLKAYHFGAAPIGCHIIRKQARGDQTFCLAKVLFPRGDAASLLFGFNATGKITGISLMSMAGD
jgi:hypothetical protein